MKKLFVPALMLAIAFSLAACGDNKSAAKKPANEGLGVKVGNVSASMGKIAATWPEDWPADIPKIEGTVVSVSGKGMRVRTNQGGGRAVGLTIAGGDSTVAEYKNLLVSKGWAVVDDGMAPMLKNDTYSITIFHSAGSKYCTVALFVNNANDIFDEI